MHSRHKTGGVGGRGWLKGTKRKERGYELELEGEEHKCLDRVLKNFCSEESFLPAGEKTLAPTNALGQRTKCDRSKYKRKATAAAVDTTVTRVDSLSGPTYRGASSGAENEKG